MTLSDIFEILDLDDGRSARKNNAVIKKGRSPAKNIPNAVNEPIMLAGNQPGRRRIPKTVNADIITAIDPEDTTA